MARKWTKAQRQAASERMKLQHKNGGKSSPQKHDVMTILMASWIAAKEKWMLFGALDRDTRAWYTDGFLDGYIAAMKYTRSLHERKA